jgi:hypothetical protein
LLCNRRSSFRGGGNGSGLMLARIVFNVLMRGDMK